jgi:HEAT repeat protein
MCDIQNNRAIVSRATRGVLVALLLVGAFAPAPSARADAVDELKQTLQEREKDLANLEKLPGVSADKLRPVLEYWREALTKKTANLRTTGDLWSALGLKDWKDHDGLSPMSLRDMDSGLRRQVGTRLKNAIEDIIATGDANMRLAVANSIAERGPTYLSLSTVKDNKIVDEEPAGFMRGLTPQIIKLAEDKDLGVREQALRALGNIFPRPQDAVPVFRKALTTESFVVPRRLAADGLGQLIRVVGYLAKPGRPATEVNADRGDVLATATAVLDASGAGLGDNDPLVRKYCLENIKEAAQAMADLILGSSRKEYPSSKRKPIEAEKQALRDLFFANQAELKMFLGVLDALRKQVPALAQSLKDPVGSVRLAAVDALENIGNARIRLKNRLANLPGMEGEKSDDQGAQSLLAANDPLAAFVRNNLASIAVLLADPDVKIRRKAVEFLDVIEDAGTPALPALARSLSDPDRIVRQSASRAIYNIAPEKAVAAVPGLAKLLSDPDLSVRIQAAKTLKEMGPVAQAAAPALAFAVVSGDAEARVAAMEALQSVGPAAGKIAVPQLIEALSYPDARVRRLAAKTLGSFGPAAFPALDALRACLGDQQDATVRINASDAILEILQRREKY